MKLTLFALTIIVLAGFSNLALADSSTSYTATKVTSGQYYSCAIFSNGRIKCWGTNTYGQLGLGDQLNRGDAANEMGSALPFVNLGTDSSGAALAANDIQAGVAHACAIMADNRVKCWGWNDRGQLGYGDTSMRGHTAATMGNNLGYVELGIGLTAKQLALGAYHTCVLLSSNAVKCWGDNSLGQLGQGHVTPLGTSPGQMGGSLPAINLGAGRTVKSIAAGHAHTCAILDNNTIKCWGNNADGELGIGSVTNRGDGTGEMGDSLPTVNLGTFNGANLTAVSLSAGTSHTCALLNTYQIKCWGDNYAGQLGIGSDASTVGTLSTDMGNNLPTVNLGSSFGAGTQPVQKLQVGFYTTCVLLSTNQVKCWGANDFGQLGLGSGSSSFGTNSRSLGDNLPVVNVGSNIQVKSMSSDYGTTCVILQDSAIKCWGINTGGALGLGDTTNRGGSAAQMGNSLAKVALGADGSSSGSTPDNSQCLSLESSVVALSNSTVAISGSAAANGSVVLLGASTLSLSGNAQVTNMVMTPAASQVTKSGSASYGSLVVQDLSLQNYVIPLFATAMNLLPPTATYSGVSGTGTWSGNGGLNVIKINGDINLGGNSDLDIHGSSNDIFIVLVSGAIDVGASGKISLSGGIPVDNVIFVVASSNATAVSISGSGEASGTMLAPNGGLSISGSGKLLGAVFAKGTIKISGAGSTLSNPFCPSGTNPNFM